MRYLFIYALCILGFTNLSAQTGTIRGTAKDSVGRPIPHASLKIERTSIGAVADASGGYTVTDVPAGQYILHFSAVGYKSATRWVEVMANETTEINFEAEEKIELLREIEVSGVRSISGMGYMEDHDGVIYSGKKTEVLLLDSLDANTAQNNPRQVLGRVPGANYSETQGSGFPSNGIGFRGLNPTQSVETNTRQNGYNLAADIFGYPETYYLPPLEAVERIEVTRGESSLQFGPQFGGVINYILRDGNKDKPVEYTTQQTGGSYGLLNSFHSLGGQLGKFNYYSFLQYQTTQGWRPNSDYRQLSAFGKLTYQASPRLKL